MAGTPPEPNVRDNNRKRTPQVPECNALSELMGLGWTTYPGRRFAAQSITRAIRRTSNSFTVSGPDSTRGRNRIAS